MEKIDSGYYAELIGLKNAIHNNDYILNLDLRRDNVFDFFAEMFKFINPEQKKLVVELMKNYVHIREYSRFVNKICDHIEGNFSKARIALCPVMSNGGIKSGHSVVYETRSALRKEIFSKLSIYDSKEKLIKNIGNYDAFILLDDFIGSGNQADTFIRSTWQDFSKIHIMTIVIQSEAILKLGSVSNTIYHVLPARNKSITDNYAIGDFTVDIAKKLYEQIENLIQISDKYKYGYEQVEALVSMKRTPNDTLPIFWCNRMKSGDRWPCPFERM